MQKSYPEELWYGANSAVIAFSETQLVKIFTTHIKSSIDSETEKMKFTKTINTLVSAFIQLEYPAKVLKI